MAVVGPTGLLTGPWLRGQPWTTVVAGPGAFQLAIATLAVVALLDVVVGWALFRVFASTDRGLARLAGWSRVAYAAVFAVAISQLLGVADLLEGGAGEPSAQARAAALAGLADFHAVWQAALALFGVHLVLTGRLAYTSRLVPRPVAVLVALAGLGYLVDSLGTWLVADYAISVGAITAVGELLLGVWLLAQRHPPRFPVAPPDPPRPGHRAGSDTELHVTPSASGAIDESSARISSGGRKALCGVELSSPNAA